MTPLAGLEGMRTSTRLGWVTTVMGLGLVACDIEVIKHDDEDDDATSGPVIDHGSDSEGYGSEGGDDGSSSGTTGIPVDFEPASNEVDLLFVIDDSGSMAQEQEHLTAALAGLLPRIDAPDGLDLRIAVTNTDTGNPFCHNAGYEGGLRLSSCLGRLQDFVFQGSEVELDGTAACTALCSTEHLEILPTAVEGDPNFTPRPWVEVSPGATNVAGDLQETLGCMLPMGISGCGFESPLEALRLALVHTANPASPNFGFMRPEAHLVVVFVTDEADCSYRSPDIFLPDEGRVFWSDSEAIYPTSAVCWNAGTVCEGSGANRVCRAQDFDLEGLPTSNPAEAVLQPLSRYEDYLHDLAVDKAQRGAGVFLYGIVGVPEDFALTGLLGEATSTDPNFVDDYGTPPGCVSEHAEAVPPIRVLELMDAFGPVQQRAFSICDESYDDEMHSIFDDLDAHRE